MAIAALMLEAFHDPALTPDDLLARLAWLRDVVAPRLERFLGYYRNPTTELAAAVACAPATPFAVRPFRQFQEIGLPARITGFRRSADGTSAATGPMDMQRKEVVIENDIGWRIDTLVDFAAARLPAITSTARDPALRRRLAPIVNAILELYACGAVRLLQELVLQGAVNGSAWIQIRPSAALLDRLTGGTAVLDDPADAAAPPDVGSWLKLEVLDARHVLAFGPYVAVLRRHASDSGAPVAPGEFRTSGASGAPGAPGENRANGTYGASGASVVPRSASVLDRLRHWLGGAPLALAPAPENFSFDLFGPHWWQSYQHGVLRGEGINPFGIAPLIRHENAGDPAAGTRAGPTGGAAVDPGLGDVEPLIGLQDELNTRLSDRAYRVTMSSFRMYLGKGIDDFIKRPVGPGQMWGTDNPDAAIETFGGDAATPSEDTHINEVREALDKLSGVSPVAAGLIRGKLGNLTSAIALLARTERKRAALTRTMAALVGAALAVLDQAGVLKIAPEDRGIDVNWPTALPESDMDRLTEAQAKLALGVPREVVLTELGYGELALQQEPKAVPAQGAGAAADRPGAADAAAPGAPLSTGTG